jgi:hypothetical protein
MSYPQNQQPQYGQQPYGQQPYGQQPYGQQPKNSAAAITGFVLGLLSLIVLFINGLLGLALAIAGLIVSIVGMNQVKNSNGALTGRGFAIAGLVLSIISLVLFLLMVVLVASFFALFF